MCPRMQTYQWILRGSEVACDEYEWEDPNDFHVADLSRTVNEEAFLF